LTGVEKAQAQSHAGCALQRKMKPLRKFTGVVAADIELNILRVGQTQHLDGAGVKLG